MAQPRLADASVVLGLSWHFALIDGQLKRLEPDAGKLASPVLRGERCINVLFLPDGRIHTRQAALRCGFSLVKKKSQKL